MDILFLLIPIGLGFLIIALALFFWAIRNGQYDDMDSQSLKIIMDEHRSDKKSANIKQTQQSENLALQSLEQKDGQHEETHRKNSQTEQ